MPDQYVQFDHKIMPNLRTETPSVVSESTDTVFAEINAPGAQFLEAIKNIPKAIGFVYSPLWKITYQDPSVLCTPLFENHCFWWALISANTVMYKALCVWHNIFVNTSNAILFITACCVVRLPPTPLQKIAYIPEKVTSITALYVIVVLGRCPGN